MLVLDNVTLIAVTSLDYKGHKKAIQHSLEGIRWGAVKMIWDPRIRNIDDWNKTIVYDLQYYVRTDFALLIHADGYVVKPQAWKEEFLQYDYVGAPWPMPSDEHSYRTPGGELVRVGNSVSLRSKKILQLPSQLNLEWKSYYGNTNEDGFLCVHNRDILQENGVKYAPMDVAKYFSKEHAIPENQGIETFAFHEV